MTSYQIARVGAFGAVVAWAAKAVAIGVAGGLDRSPAEGPLFLLGMVCALIGAAALGVALVPGGSVGRRVLAGFAAVVAVILVALVAGQVAAALQPEQDPGWAWGEVNLWAAALVLLAAVLLAGRSRSLSEAAPAA